MGRTKKYLGTSTSRNPKTNTRAKRAKEAWVERRKKATESIEPIAECSHILYTVEDRDEPQTATERVISDVVMDTMDTTARNDSQSDTSDLTLLPSTSTGKGYEGTESSITRPELSRKVYPGAKKPTASAAASRSEFGIMSSMEYESIMSHQLTVESENPPPEAITGNRIVEVGYFAQQIINAQYEHMKICTFGKLHLYNEYNRGMGLVSCIILKCASCDREFKIFTENPNKQSSSLIDQSTMNIGSVWGTIASGGSYSHMCEYLSALDIPVMHGSLFYQLEDQLGEIWKESLWKSMKAAGLKEKENAIANGNLCNDGIPWITVYLDGSWSKRSYGHNYNALSGMVAIIGKYTKKILYLGVRNRYCSVCARGENESADIKMHHCFKNWNKSAPAMEADMVVEGFCQSENTHGVRYGKFIADGDSSTFAKIKTNVPYGSTVKKVECTNHALKNYGKHLHKIKSDTKINLSGRRLLTVEKIKLLTKRAKASIYEHANAEMSVSFLRKDLEIGFLHVFGDHSNCRVNICNTVGDVSNNAVPQLKATSMYDHINGALELLIRKANLLIENENNNAAECLMNIVSRFNMGKRVNLVQRGSYERRVYLAALRYNKAFEWPISPWKNVTGATIGENYQQFIKTNMAIKDSKVRRRLVQKKVSLKRKNIVKPVTKIDTTAYGPSAEQPEEEEQNIEEECQRLIQHLHVEENEIPAIAEATMGQFFNDVYIKFKERRLTASNFGRVVKRRPYTPCHGIVKQCLGKNIFSTEATEYGISKESVAIKAFEKKQSVTVTNTGLWIHKDYGFLGASPDGLVGTDAIVEVKCLYSCSKLEETDLEKILLLKKNTCLQLKDGKISLNRRHSYYYQVQGTLNITKRSKCYFVVYINDAVPLYIEEIEIDIHFWEHEMVPILLTFYKMCIAPEIIRNNIGKGKKCVDPQYIIDAIKNREAQLMEACKKKRKTKAENLAEN
ncbi:uncharacterized protein LOC116162414 [Photinus pyralis]|nr:uncharacterized protein LOC116162414 [Photinus pyralis]